ncbi:MAG: NIPSNAP family protein [Planctomycetia bacterium]|nr:NIPSNAP family protein [Planctomycetia bacterium]
MKRFCALVVLAGVLSAASRTGSGEQPAAKKDAPPLAARVYGEWRIQVRPDKAKEYAQLIETKGLPLFREAGGRMVGWWTTLVGDLYEHVTIWEYDDMTAFERAVQKLGKDKRFAEFVEKRDPLLSGEENRFLRLTAFAAEPTLPENSKVIVHEVHRVPLARMQAYLQFMQSDGMDLLRRHGFKPVGPWMVGVGNWSEVSYLFRYDSLQERDELMARFAAHDDVRTYSGKLNEFADEVTTRILLPAPFAHRSAPAKP